jgi:hypothetical protein
MPKGKKAAQSNSEGLTKREGVRRALAELGPDAQPSDIQAFVKSRFGIDMDKALISSYKTALKAAGNKGPGRKVAPKPAKATNATMNGGVSLEDIRAVKELTERVGAERVKQLADVLAT